MKKLLLIDAYAIIYRSYYAFIKNPRINSKGFNTSVVLGFNNTLELVLRDENPTHVAVAFDPSGTTFRHDAYPQYKANREETPEDIRKSIPVIKNLVAAYNIPVLQIPKYEADDVIGTISQQAAAKGYEVLMMTPDKDYGQLVNDRVFMYKPKHIGNGFDRWGVNEVLSKYGISRTNQVIDLLGLMGDASDNIPGCPGVGEKTAVKLINEFDSIPNLLANTDKLKGALKSKIEENKEKIEFSRFLATIKTDVPVEWTDQLLLKKQPDEEKLSSIFKEMEFKSLLKKHNPSPQPQQMSLFDTPADIQIQIPAEPEPQQTLSNIHSTPHQYHLVASLEECKDLASKLMQQPIVCFDTETTGLNIIDDHIVGMSFSYLAHQGYYVTVSPHNAQQTIDTFKTFFESQNIAKVGQNLKFDLLMLLNYDIQVKGTLFDTMIAHYLLQPELHHNMDYLAEIYLRYKTVHIEELIGPKGKNQLTMDKVDTEKIKEYAAEDADITWQLYEVLKIEIEKNNLQHLFSDIEMPLMLVLADLEHNGVHVDPIELQHSSAALTKRMNNLEADIHQMAGFKFNISSSRQVGEILFNTLKIDEKARKTKTGQYCTNEEVLQSLKGKHPIVEKILDYRGLKKLLNTYIESLPQLINKKTGRIHASFNQTVAATGRLSSSNPNMQNIPVRDEDGKEIRKAFVAEPDCTFMSADYSQIELRVMAHLSQDQNMVAAFFGDQDIHSATAAKIYHTDDVTSEMRRKAKTANFGIIYGISVFGLAQRLDIPRSEAKELIEGYFLTYPHIKQYMDESIAKAKTQGYVQTMLGRKRFLPDINSHNAIVRGFAERNAINAPIQGTAADIIKIAMVNIRAKMKHLNLKSKLINQVHDELDFNVPNNELQTMRSLVKQEMESAVKLSVPLKVDIGEGKNWLEAH